MDKRPWPRSITLPIILIIGGIALLVGNLFGWNMWDFVIRLWPVWLIALGLDILFGRGSRAGAIAVTAVTLVVLAGGIWFYSANPIIQRGEGAGEPVAAGSIDQPLNGATQADITISPSVGQFRIHESNDPSMLVTGTVYRLDGESLNKNASMSAGNTAIYSLKSNLVAPLPNIGSSRRGTWDLGLTTAVPLHLTVNTGVGEAYIDLSRLAVRILELHSGVGASTITVPSQGEMRGTINCGVGQTTIIVPKGVAFRIQGHTGLGNFSINMAHQREGNTYTSPDYNSAANRVDLDVSGGVGEIRLLSGN